MRHSTGHCGRSRLPRLVGGARGGNVAAHPLPVVPDAIRQTGEDRLRVAGCPIKRQRTIRRFHGLGLDQRTASFDGIRQTRTYQRVRGVTANA